MATKISRSDRNSTPATDAAEELDVLHPERMLTLAGRRVAVREYGGIEWMRMQSAARPLVVAIAGMLDAGTVPTYEEALDVISAHIDGLLPLIALAADLQMTDIETLSPDDVELLLMTWWGVNGRFFIARATNRVAVARAEVRLAQSAGANSTQPSSPTDMTSTESVDTPPAN